MTANTRMSLNVRKPDGGEAVMVVRATDTVETLRAMLTWCASSQQWDCDAIPRDIVSGHSHEKRNSNTEGDTTTTQREEMWTLGGEPDVDAGASTHKPWEVPQSEEEVDFEQAATRDVVHEDESVGVRIELMFGPMVMQDGYKLTDYGVESGSFVHPIYGLRPSEGGAAGWDQVVQSLPWRDSEWYRAGLQVGTMYGVAAGAAVQDRWASVVDWWGGARGVAEGEGDGLGAAAARRAEPGGIEARMEVL